jgi:hypothetical protein
MQFLDKTGLKAFLDGFKKILGSRDNLETSMATRREYLLEIDYEKDLAFNTDVVIGNSTSQLNVGLLNEMILG